MTESSESECGADLSGGPDVHACHDPEAATAPARTGQRLIGFDLARCLAFFGMVVVNYRYLMGGFSGQPEWLLGVFDVVTGRAAATFVILAGIGISLLYQARRSPAAAPAGVRRILALLRPLVLVLFLCVSWIAMDFYVAEKAADRPFSFGPLARAPRPVKDKEPVAPLGERLADHLGKIQSGEFSVFLKVGGGLALVLLLAFWIFNRRFRSARGILFKRAVFLAAFGYLWYPAWSFDILHYYGFYLLAGCLFLSLRSRWVVLAMVGVLGGAFWLQFSRDATEPREWISVWEGWGAARNLFIGGFHPVLPWLAFLLLGICLGRVDSGRTRTRVAFIVIGVAMAVSGHLAVKPITQALDPEAYVRHAPEDSELVLEEKRPAPRRRGTAPAGDSSNTSFVEAKGDGKKGPLPVEPLPLSTAAGFPTADHGPFLAGAEKLRIDLAQRGPWDDRRLRVEMVDRGGETRPALILSVSYGEGNPAPTRHKRDLKSARGWHRRAIIYNEKELARDKAEAEAEGDDANMRRLRERKAWPAAVSVFALERRMPVRRPDATVAEVVWDTTWVDAESIRNPTAAQRLATMNGLSSEGNSPFYVFTAIGTSLAVIGICLVLGSVGRLKRVLVPFVRTGQMTLSLYVCHAAVGFYVLKWMDMTRGNDLRFIAFYVVTCWIVSIAVSHAWRSFFSRGPFELMMRWMTD